MTQIIDGERIVSCPSIDTDARWGYGHTKGWIFGYKLHLICTTTIDGSAVPLTADITTANVQDNRMMCIEIKDKEYRIMTKPQLCKRLLSYYLIWIKSIGVN